MSLRGITTTDTAQIDLPALLAGCCVAQLNDRAFLRISGPDATRWLNGMVTNSIEALKPGEGNYNFLLSAQGRIQGDCNVFRESGADPSYLLETSSDQIEMIHSLLDKFIIMDDVELVRVLEEQASILLLGERAPKLLQHLGLPNVEPMHYVFASNSDGDLHMFGSTAGPVPAVHLRAPGSQTASLRSRATAMEAIQLTPEALEAVRIFAGIPRYGTDIRDRDLPQETNQPQALHFAKGCYLGQEIVERIRSRGQVHRLLMPFRLDGTLPALPAALEANGKPAGELSSAVQIGEHLYALGYARREALETKQPLTYNGGTALPRTIEAPERIQTARD